MRMRTDFLGELMTHWGSGQCGEPATDLIADVLQQFRGTLRITGSVGVGVVGDGNYVGEPGASAALEVVASHPCDDRRRDGPQSDRGGELSSQSLVIESSFASDDQVGSGDVPVKAQQVEEILR